MKQVITMKQNRCLSLLSVILGNMLYTLTVKLFLLPANLISCGTTGLGLVVNHFTGIPITGFLRPAPHRQRRGLWPQ